ncbi:hypothetical protein DFJ73DRAFT_814595 [Zopfochytrium polystomum]|nr:hypothetical protein DFJ73DRAFT_814595 [Zopfochytrium polystomum]
MRIVVSAILALLMAAAAGRTLLLVHGTPLARRDFGPFTIYTPPSNYTADRTLYARSLMLTVDDPIGTLLATWENYSPAADGPVYFPIYRSTDHGYSWTQLSIVTDQANGWGLRYQPILYELKRSFAGFPAGTVLLAGNSIPTDLSKTQLDLYASTGQGIDVAVPLAHCSLEARRSPTTGKHLCGNRSCCFRTTRNQLIVYYSDQRDPKYGQKIVHQTSTDLKSWGPVVDDVVSSVYAERPGMPVVALLPNGQYIMTYEHGGAPEANFAVRFKLSADPLAFGSVGWTTMRLTDNSVPTSSPYVIWTPAGSGAGTNGTIVATAYSSSDLFLNKNLGSGPWTRLSTASPSAYSRHIAAGFKAKDIVVMGAGRLGEGPTNKVTVTARDVNGCSTC